VENRPNDRDFMASLVADTRAGGDVTINLKNGYFTLEPNEKRRLP